MKHWLTYHYYAITVALQRLIAQPFSTLTNIFVIGLSLSIPLLSASTLLSLQPVAKQIPVAAQITLFAQHNAPGNEVNKLAHKLQNDHSNIIDSVQIITRDQALTNLKSSSSWASALNVLTDNPLPDAIVIKLKQSSDQAEQAHALAQEWRTLNLIDSVQLDSEWIQRLAALLQVLSMGTGILAFIIGLVVLSTVFNTVRMQALTLRDEIAVVRMVGATEPFVRRPFLYLGAITGLASTLIAVTLTKIALKPINNAVSQLAHAYDTSMLIQLPQTSYMIYSAITVVLVAALAARWSVSRHTYLA